MHLINLQLIFQLQIFLLVPNFLNAFQKSASLYHPSRGQNDERPTSFNIGAVLDSSESVSQFLQAIQAVNLEPNIFLPGLSLYAISLPIINNPVRMLQDFCEKLISKQVFAVIVSDEIAPEANAITQTCNFFNIPVIGIANRESYISDKHMNNVYLRTVPPYSHQVDVWVEILLYLNYTHVVFIHSADYDGRIAYTRFVSQAEKLNIHIRSVIEYDTMFSEIGDELIEADEEHQCRVYLLYSNILDAQTIYNEARRLNMTGQGYVWLVSELAAQATNVPDGALALRLFKTSNGSGHIIDSVYVVAMALRNMYLNENMTRPPSHCGDLDKNQWPTGPIFFQYLRKQYLQYGKTGKVAFDSKGDRVDADYDVVNIVNQRPVPIGQYTYSQTKRRMQLWLTTETIVWPGLPDEKPLGYVRPTHLRVVTLNAEPFIYTQPINSEYDCIELGQAVCSKIDPVDQTEKLYCCYGFCIDLLLELSRRLNFTYTLYQVSDGMYGNFDHINGTDKPKYWTGLVADLLYGKADMIVAPLTINPERSLFIEFSKPFKYQGITVLEKQQPRRASLASFMQPFEESLWLTVMVSVHVVALALYLLDRFSPFGRYKLPNSEVTEEDALNLSSAIWFAWGVLLNSGIGEGTPRSFSGRVLGMVWAGFAMIVVASYTANLAAFLVLGRPETALSGINDARLRYPMPPFTYATVKGSSVEMYFKRQVELSNMYKHMAERNYHTVEDAINGVRNGEISAFIYDSSRLEYEAAKDCDLITAAEQFGRSGYGIGLQKGSFWTEQVNSAILSMHENRVIENLDKKWILQESSEDFCQRGYEVKPATLGLRNMAGVFLLVGAGIVGGIGLIVIEVVYKKRQTNLTRQLEAARNAAEKWKRFVEKRRVYRANLHQIRQEQIRQEQIRAEKMREEQIRLEQVRQAQIRHAQQQEQQYYEQQKLRHEKQQIEQQKQQSYYQQTQIQQTHPVIYSQPTPPQPAPRTSSQRQQKQTPPKKFRSKDKESNAYTVEKGLSEIRDPMVAHHHHHHQPPTLPQLPPHQHHYLQQQSSSTSSQYCHIDKQSSRDSAASSSKLSENSTPTFRRELETHLGKASTPKSKKDKEKNKEKKSPKETKESKRKRMLMRESSIHQDTRSNTPEGYFSQGGSRSTPSPRAGQHLMKPPHALVYQNRPQDFSYNYGYTT